MEVEVATMTMMMTMTGIPGDPAGGARMTMAPAEGGHQAEAAHQAAHQAVLPADRAGQAGHLWIQDSALSGRG